MNANTATPLPKTYEAKLHPNHRFEADAPYPDQLKQILSHEKFEEAKAVITQWPGYEKTELVNLKELAKESGVGTIWYKDESTRFGLRSFKALGGAYAVFRLLQEKIREQTGDTVTPKDLFDGKHKDIVSGITVTCATDGNHGRSVAWGAQLFGCRCVIYIHALVSKGREAAILAYDAEVIRTEGNYDDSVRQAQEDALAEGRYVISDTSYEGYMEVPKNVMQGYSVMVDEAVEQMGKARPTHVFVQGGVGGMAAAVIAHLWELWEGELPRMVVVEPEKADCLYRSAVDGGPVVVHGELDTVMAGLACGEVSLLAWEILQVGASDFMTIPDEAALDCMRILADGKPPVVAGESAVAGLAGMLTALQHPEMQKALGLDSNSKVLFFGTEGDTDPELYEKIVGRTADEVRKGK